MEKVLRPDLIFSDWIYIWFVLYYFSFIKWSPKFALIIGLIENVVMLLLVILYGTKKKTALHFFIVIFMIKIIPLYYLKDENIKWKDVKCTLYIFILFNIWLYMNGQTFISNGKKIHDSLIYGKGETPFMSFFNKL